MRTATTMRTVCLVLIATFMLVLSPPAAAEPPERFEENGLFTLVDFDNQFIVFVNIDRESLCTPELVAFEQAVADWLDGGQVGPPPSNDDVNIPDGFDPFQIQRPDVPNDSNLVFLRGDDVHLELWHWDDVADRGRVGACLDTDDRAERFAVGTGDLAFHATAFEFSGTEVRDVALRHGDIVDADGQRYKYQLHGHDNLSCLDHAESQNACLVRNSRLQPVQN